MSVSKRGKTWYVKFRPFGEPIQLALKGCEGKRQAMAIEAELLYALRQKAYDGLTGPARENLIKLFVNQKWELPSGLSPDEAVKPPKVYTIWDGVKLYVQDESFRKLSKPVRYEQALAHLVDFFGQEKPLKNIWVPDIKLYRTHRSNQGAENSTINREMSALSGVFRILVEHQILEANPTRLLRRLSEKSSLRQVYVSHEDIRRIMTQCPDWFGDMMKIAYLTGMRQGEVHGLKWRHVNLRTRIISFHGSETKEGRPKRVPIHMELMPLFEKTGRVRYLSEDSLFQTSYQSLRWPWVRALKKLDWLDPKPRFHDLRHTWKANARRSGIDSEITESILGHGDRNLDVRERYGIISDSELVRAIDKFTYEHGPTNIVVAHRAKNGI